MLKKWHRRFCVVSPELQEIVYFEREPEDEEEESKPRGRIGLEDAEVAEKDIQRIMDENCFVFVLKTKRAKFYLACKSELERQSWLSAIRLTKELGSRVRKKYSEDEIWNSDVEEQGFGKVSVLDLAAGEMMDAFENFEFKQRDKLISVANHKWSTKCKLAEIQSDILSLKQEITEEYQELKNEEERFRQDLNELNRDLSLLDQFCRKSTRIQWEAVQAFNNAPSVAEAAFSLTAKFLSSMEQPSKSFIEILHKHFSSVDENAKTNFEMSDVIRFYHEYYARVHLPQKEELDRAKEERFWFWKQLVRAVTKARSSELQLVELELILSLIGSALDSKFQPDFMDSLPEDIPQTYNREWKQVSDLVQQLMDLRKEQSEVQNELNATLQNRELLKDWSSEMKDTSNSSTQ